MALDVIADVTLDMQHPGINVVHVNQYDSARKVKAQLQNGGVAWSVPSGAYGIVMFKKTDNKGGFYDTTEFNENAVSIDNNDRSIVYAALDVQTMTVSGNVDVQIAFFQSGKKISTFSFSLQVHASPIQNAELESNWIFNILAHEMSEIITDAATISPAVITAWLEAHVSPETGYVIDNTLTVQGAAADAKAVGDRTLIQKGNLSSSDNLNTFTKAGQWLLPANAGYPTNWPAQSTGRLIVFGDASSDQSFKVQVVVDYDGYVFVRRGRSANWSAWNALDTISRSEEAENNILAKALIFRRNLSASDDIDNISSAGQWNLLANTPYPANWPCRSTGRLIVFGDETNSSTLRVQMVVDYDGSTYIRRGRADGWSDWVDLDERVFYSYTNVRRDGTGDLYFPGSAIMDAMMWRDRYDKHHKLIIDIGEGTFDLQNVLIGYDIRSFDNAGLFIPPNVEVRGRGKDRTKLTLYYTGTDDDFMSKVSGLNMPYASSLRDLTISVKNVRYAVHSDGAMYSDSEAGIASNLVNNIDIVVENCRFEHLGFDEQHVPTYNAPAAWGGGSHVGGTRKFINCDFISKQNAGFLNHNAIGVNVGTDFVFENCAFIGMSGNTTVGDFAAYYSCALISWGASGKNHAVFKNCKVNKSVGLTVKTDNGNPNAVIDYDVFADNDLTIVESKTNDSYKNNNYFTDNCQVDFASESISAYAPVSKNGVSGLRALNPSDKTKGIALHDCAADGECVYQTKGIIAVPLLTTNTFPVGTKLGYSNGQWVQDNTNPMLEVIWTNYAMLL